MGRWVQRSPPSKRNKQTPTQQTKTEAVLMNRAMSMQFNLMDLGKVETIVPCWLYFLLQGLSLIHLYLFTKNKLMVGYNMSDWADGYRDHLPARGTNKRQHSKVKTIVQCWFYSLCYKDCHWFTPTLLQKTNQWLVIIWVIGRMGTEITYQQKEQTNVDIATKTEAVLMNRAMSMPLASSAVVRKK